MAAIAIRLAFRGYDCVNTPLWPVLFACGKYTQAFLCGKCHQNIARRMPQT
jgi:hypothetical protein